MIKGLQQTLEYQHNLKGENEQLKRNTGVAKKKLKSQEQEYNGTNTKLVQAMKMKEEEHKIEISRHQYMQRKTIK